MTYSKKGPLRVIEPNAKFVRTAGDHKLASALLLGLHKTLFGSVKRPRFRRGA